jgi:hypothetical protein
MIPSPGELSSDWWRNSGYEETGYEDVFYHDVLPRSQPRRGGENATSRRRR